MWPRIRRAPDFPDAYAAGTACTTLDFFGGGGLISAILRRQSASESCGPETNVPLTFVLYQPETTPSLVASSVLTWRGERICMCCFQLGARMARGKVRGIHAGRHRFSPVLFRSCFLALFSAFLGKPGKVVEDRRDEIAVAGVVRRQARGV